MDFIKNIVREILLDLSDNNNKDQVETVALFKYADHVRHVKTGRVYAILGTPDQFRIEETGEPAYAYISVDDYPDRSKRQQWIRSQKKMEDGRFVKVEK